MELWALRCTIQEMVNPIDAAAQWGEPRGYAAPPGVSNGGGFQAVRLHATNQAMAAIRRARTYLSHLLRADISGSSMKRVLSLEKKGDRMDRIYFYISIFA